MSKIIPESANILTEQRKSAISVRVIESPCIRNCCLDNHDICVGCKRSLAEILEWSEASSQRKAEIVTNCRIRALETSISV